MINFFFSTYKNVSKQKSAGTKEERAFAQFGGKGKVLVQNGGVELDKERDEGRIMQSEGPM